MLSNCRSVFVHLYWRVVLEVLGLPAVSRCVCRCHGSVVGSGCLVWMSLLRPISHIVAVCSPHQYSQNELQLSCYWGKVNTV